MVILLLTSVLFLGLVAIAIYFWQRPAKTSQTIELPPPPHQHKGLFSDFGVNELRPATPLQPKAEPGKVTAEDFEEAIAAIRTFQQSPNRTSTTKLLHVAALTDDAKTFGRAMELVLMSWRDRTLSELSAEDLQALFNSEYWVLSSRSRTSGAGFVLKQTLADANRELEGTNHN